MHRKLKARRSILPEEADELREKGLIFKFIDPLLLKKADISNEAKELCRKHRISKLLYLRLKQAYDNNGLEGVFNILRRRGFKRTEWNEIGKIFKEK